LKDLIGHYKEMDKLVCGLVPWPAGLSIKLDHRRRQALADVEYFKKGPDAISSVLNIFSGVEGARLDMEKSMDSLQQLKEIYHDKERTDAVISFLVLSEKISLIASQYKQATAFIQEWEDKIDEYINEVQHALTSIQTHSPLNLTKSWATNLSFTSPNNSPGSIPRLGDTDSMASNPRTYTRVSTYQRIRAFPHNL
jgi:hypothetical protein